MSRLAGAGTEGLALIKPSVRAQAAYTLAAPAARRKLNQNESPLDFPPELKEAILKEVSRAPWQRYPEFAPPALLARLAERYGWTADGVLVGNGSNELIQATLSVTLEAGDRVVAPAPTFALYRLLTAVLGGCYVPVPFGDDFSYDVDRLIETAVRERARVVVLNSPNNPTGSVLPPGAVERVLRETEALVVCDEAYQDFGGPTALGLLAESSRLVVLRTFSKAMGAAGLRFGLALAHPAVTREIAKGKLPYNVNVVTLAAAAAVLEHQPVWSARVRDIIDTRERFLARLRQVPGITVYPTAANFVLIRCGAVPAKTVFRRLLEEYGILVRDVSNTAELAECLRISIGSADDMDAVLDALGAIFGESLMSDSVSRVGEVRRATKETALYVRVDLDGRGEARVATGIGFFDHMLEALARHGLIDLTVEGQGDLHIDGHHTVEDTGIAIGQAIAQALGDRTGIRRYADATVPLDEALVRAVVDVSGRPFLAYHADIAKWQMLGDYDVFLTPEFFRALVLNAGLTAHIDLVRGDNPHHIVEAAFKAFARALGGATALDQRVRGVPSTKGVL